MFSKTSRCIAIAAVIFALGVGQAQAQEEASACQTVQPATPLDLKALHDRLNLSVSAALKPQFENIAHHPAKPYDPRTGL